MMDDETRRLKVAKYNIPTRRPRVHDVLITHGCGSKPDDVVRAVQRAVEKHGGDITIHVELEPHEECSVRGLVAYVMEDLTDEQIDLQIECHEAKLRRQLADLKKQLGE